MFIVPIALAGIIVGSLFAGGVAGSLATNANQVQSASQAYADSTPAPQSNDSYRYRHHHRHHGD